VRLRWHIIRATRTPYVRENRVLRMLSARSKQAEAPMNEFRCPRCRKLLSQILFEGKHLLISVKCPRCSTVSDYEITTGSSGVVRENKTA
jgi:phage FluMu protein Com